MDKDGTHNEISSAHRCPRGECPPPRARGSPESHARQRRFLGSTPAYAGTTCRPPWLTRAPRVHPRVRGDHALMRRLVAPVLGPPPRARGPHGAAVGGRPDPGSTPACAGTTQPGWPVPGPGRVHPRVRGDHYPSQNPYGGRWGPPPRARGPLAGTNLPVAIMGSTPACAGTTRSGWPHRHCPGVHPRVRGDHLVTSNVLHLGWGPPPRARGPQATGGVDVLVQGSTPACAGTTAYAMATSARMRVHPRVRGGHGSVGRCGSCGRGSPPRARGPQAVTCSAMRDGGRFYSLLQSPAFGVNTQVISALPRAAHRQGTDQPK